MTTSQWVKSLKAKRAGPGKWMAKCPVHREKTASLSIKAGKTATLIHCFGCLAGGKQVAESLGLSVCDLYYDSKPDKAALREAERQRALEERERQKLLERSKARWQLPRTWYAVAKGLAPMLIEHPENKQLAELYHHCLGKSRST